MALRANPNVSGVVLPSTTVLTALSLSPGAYFAFSVDTPIETLDKLFFVPFFYMNLTDISRAVIEAKKSYSRNYVMSNPYQKNVLIGVYFPSRAVFVAGRPWGGYYVFP